MAQPVNTFDSYDMVGIREDLSDVIYNIAPDSTPLLTRCPKVKATNTLHEWQTETLRASAVNSAIEGGDVVARAITPTVRLGNYTQIFDDAVSIPDTDAGLKKAGRGEEMAHQLMLATKALKLDIEKALFANQARSAGTSGVAGRLFAGIPAWLTTNTNFQSGSSGADPTGDGTDARTDDGTPTAFSQTKFDSLMQDIWVSGGKPDTVYLSAYQMNIAQGFTGNNNQRSNIDAKSGKVVKYMSIYSTAWGDVTFIPSRENRSRDVFVLQDDMWAIATLAGLKTSELAKTGHAERRMISTELTLVSRNEKASGGIFDNTTA